MNLALGSLRKRIVSCYMNDLLIGGKDWSELLEKLELVLEALSQAGFTLRLSKCEFGKIQLEYVGFDIGPDGIKPGRRKVMAILEFKQPHDTSGVQRFHGLTYNFRMFVMRFALRAEPLTRLLKDGVKFYWSNTQETAFTDLKKAISDTPALRIYDPKAKTELHTDACAIGLAAMLLQEGEDKTMHIVYCISKKNSVTESHYHSSSNWQPSSGR
jgi:hypothetical protein